LTFPWRIYRSPGKPDPLWVPPLLPERARTLDPNRGPFFQRGDAELFLVPERRAAFSPFYLVPFGVGQLVQDRPLFAASYLGIQVGLLGWYAWVRREVSRAVDLDDLPRERELEQRRDMVLGLFVAAVAAGVIEAVVVGLATGE
jgi:hypothetical protein